MASTLDKIKLLILSLLSCIFVIFCYHAALFGQDTNTPIHHIEERVKRYYEYEKKKDWENTYLYRTPLFRKSVPFGLYKDTMNRDSKGWELLSIQVKSIKIENHLAVVEIEFLEKYPKEGFFLPKFLKKKVIAITEITLWEQIDSIWHVRNAGGRSHLSLNADLVH